MAKTTKNAPVRKPIKARGALPVPRQAPKRSFVPWYRRRGNQVIGGIVALALVGLGIKMGLDIKDRSETKKQNIAAVRRFENKLQLLQSPMQDIFTAMNQAPKEFLDGKLSPEDFKEQTETWLTEMRKLDSGLRQREIPPNQVALIEARALLVRGTVVYIDGIKSYQLASTLTDPAARQQAVALGNNTIAHGTSVFGMGQRAIEDLKKRYGLVKDDILGPVDLPPEEAPPAPPEGAGAPPGGLPPQGLPPGMLPPGSGG